MTNSALEPQSDMGGIPPKALLTVITVVKNNLAGLKKTYEHLQKQTCLDFDWLVVDGESDDGTQLWLAGVARARFRYVSRKDSSLFDAMNKAVGMIDTEYCLFLNGGDYFWDEDVVGKITEAARRQPFGFGHGRFVIGAAPGFPERVRGERIKSKLAMFAGDIPCHQASVISKQAFGEMGGYREDLGIYGDREWILRYAKTHHPSSFAFFPFVIAYYDSNGLSYHRFFKWKWTYLMLHLRLGNPLEAIVGIVGWLKTALYILSSKTLRDAGQLGTGRNGEKTNGSH